jgi:hypothetical protein
MIPGKHNVFYAKEYFRFTDVLVHQAFQCEKQVSMSTHYITDWERKVSRYVKFVPGPKQYAMIVCKGKGKFVIVFN